MIYYESLFFSACSVSSWATRALSASVFALLTCVGPSDLSAPSHCGAPYASWSSWPESSARGTSASKSIVSIFSDCSTFPGLAFRAMALLTALRLSLLVLVDYPSSCALRLLTLAKLVSHFRFKDFLPVITLLPAFEPAPR